MSNIAAQSDSVEGAFLRGPKHENSQSGGPKQHTHDQIKLISPSLKTLEQAGRAARRTDDDNAISISVYPSFAARWLVPRLSRFQTQHPDIRIKLDTSLETEDLRDQHLDLSIRFGRGKWPGHNSMKLFDETLIPVAAPSLLGK